MCFVCEQIFSFAARCGESTPVLLLSLPWYPVRTFLKRPRMCVVRVRVCVRESVSSRGEGRCPQVSTSAPSTSQTHAQSSTQRRHSTESSRDSLEPDTHFPPLRLRTELTEKPQYLETSKQGSWIQNTAGSMFSWVKQEQGGSNKEGEMYQTVTEGLQTLYTKKLLPLEETYLFHDFHSPALEPADFQSKPMVLLVGQYSTGKTTFIRY